MLPICFPCIFFFHSFQPKFSFKSEYIVKYHKLKVHERIDQRICDICARVFKTKEGYQDHLLAHSGIEEPRVQCEYCGAWLKNTKTLGKHIKLHTDGPQLCPICNKVKRNKTSLKNHMRLVHSGSNFPCTICDKKFKRMLALTVSLIRFLISSVDF